jgi:ribosome-associated protein
MSISKRNLESRKKALKLVEFVLEKKAIKPVILDVRKLTNICDYFVICSGETDKQTKAIYEEVLKKCEKNKIEIHHCENDNEAKWILIDFFDVILHIFNEEAREFYNLEYLWKEAKRVRIIKKKK